MQKNQNSHTLLLAVQNGTATPEHRVAVTLKLNIHLTYDLTIALQRIYFRETKTCVHTKTYTWMFITAVFIITKKLETTNCSLTAQRINKARYITQWHTYTTQRWKGMNCWGIGWMHLKDIMKEPSLRMWHIVWFYYYNIYEKMNLWSTDQGCQGCITKSYLGWGNSSVSWLWSGGYMNFYRC